jgi:lysozyme
MNNYENEIKLENHIKESEGYRQFLYKCPAGKLTIGYGFNVEDEGLSIEESDAVLDVKIENRKKELRTFYPQFDLLDDARQFVLIDMCYNMGITRLGKFFKMWIAIKLGNFRLASEEMKNSEYHKQIGDRADKLEKIMETGEII